MSSGGVVFTVPRMLPGEECVTRSVRTCTGPSVGEALQCGPGESSSAPKASAFSPAGPHCPACMLQWKRWMDGWMDGRAGFRLSLDPAC